MSPEMRSLMRYLAKEDKLLTGNSLHKVLLTLANLTEEDKNGQAERILTVLKNSKLEQEVLEELRLANT